MTPPTEAPRETRHELGFPCPDCGLMQTDATHDDAETCIRLLRAALEAGEADTRRIEWLAASRSEIGHAPNGAVVYTRQPDGTVPSFHAPTLREAIDLASAISHHREQTDMQSYVAEVRRVWEEHWRPKTSHRYGQDFASFLGERVLTDFNARV